MRSHKTMFAAFVLIIWTIAFCSMGFAGNDVEFIPGEDSGFYYTIKKGDTLWDLSQKFYDSQWDWPGLWEMNDEIKNPHWIYPGKKIRIFLKGKTALKPKIVPVQKVKRDAVEPTFSYSKIDHVGFLRKEGQPSLGKVIKEQEGNFIISTRDVVFIEPAVKNTLVPGNTYHIFRPSLVEEKIEGQPFKGIKHLIQGEVKILEDEGTYVKGVITDADRPVQTGDLIMEYFERNPILKVEENPDPIDARIICSENNYATVMINDYRIAFINAGKDKVKPGQIYTVFKKNEVTETTAWGTKKKVSVDLENLETGKLIVLHTEDIASTVMILSSKYEISPYDIIN